jgi:hypothetical protein
MAVLMGGSLVLIAASAGVLVIGWLNANPSMIVTSMGGLVAAGLLLLVAYVRSRRIVGRAASGLAPASSVGTRTDAVVADPAGPEPQPDPAGTTRVSAAPHESAPEVAPLPVPGAPSVSVPVEGAPAGTAASATPSTVRKTTTAKKSTRKNTTASAKSGGSRGAPKAGAATGKATPARKTTASKQPPKVIVFDGRDKYHRPGCRFAKGRGAEKVTKATARRWGYEPCSICEP